MVAALGVPAGANGKIERTTKSGIPVVLRVARGKVTEFYPKWYERAQ